MRYLASLFLASALVGMAWGQTPPAPSGSTVVFPSIPVPPPPVPVPGQATLLQTDQLYVIQSSVPVVVLASPQGVVKVTPDTGPLKIRGKFVDGTGTETRTFKGPNLYLVESVGSGNCELIVVSSMDPQTVIRRTLTTELSPPDPPGPKPPGPTPGPNPIPSDKLRVLCIWESAKTLSASQVGVLNSTIWKADVATAGGEERVFDKDTNVDVAGVEQFWKDAMKRTKASLPWVIISSPKGFYEGPLPATVADMQAQIKKVGG